MNNESRLSVPSVLIISYDFYPDASPNTYRWFNIAKKWQKEGVQVFVISANKNQFSPFEEVEGIKIYRTGEYVIGNLKYNLRKQTAAETDQKKLQNIFSIKKIAKRLLRKIYDVTWSKFYWPDYAFLWQFTASPLAIQLIKTENIGKIVTVSWMFTAHLIGLKLKRKFKNVFWLADTVDPFHFNMEINNVQLYGHRNFVAERTLFYTADLNSVLTDKIKAAYISKFKIPEEKIMVNKNVFLPANFDYTKSHPDNGVIKLVFLGTLSEQTRSPKKLLFLFDQLVKEYPGTTFDLSFYGDINDTMSSFESFGHLLNQSVFLKGRRRKEEINDIIKDADVLVNIGNSNTYQEPSKVIEYMYSGKRILNICTISEDTSANLLKIYPLHLNIGPEDLIDTASLQHVFHFLVENKTIDSATTRKLLYDYLLDTVADNYYKYLFAK